MSPHTRNKRLSVVVTWKGFGQRINDLRRQEKRQKLSGCDLILYPNNV